MGQTNVIVVLALMTAALVFIVSSGIGAPMVAAWRVIAMTLKALVQVPFGILLAAAGIAIAWWLSNLIGFLIGGVLLYIGGNLLFGAIEDLIKSSPRKR